MVAISREATPTNPKRKRGSYRASLTLRVGRTAVSAFGKVGKLERKSSSNSCEPPLPWSQRAERQLSTSNKANAVPKANRKRCNKTKNYTTFYQKISCGDI